MRALMSERQQGNIRRRMMELDLNEKNTAALIERGLYYGSNSFPQHSHDS